MRMFSAAVLPDGVPDNGDRRPVRTALRRGPSPAILVCGACANWLAVGWYPDDPDLDMLLACAACHRVNDPRRATPVQGSAEADAAGPPAELSRAEVWAKAAVERVHTLAAQEKRWPWRAESG